MKIYFLRHGVAFDSGDWEGSDFDRPLTAAGRDRMKREAKRIAELGVDPGSIVTSPLVRAKETAQIVAAQLKMLDRLIEDERLGPDFSPERLETIVAEHAASTALMVVGHEPSMSHTIGRIVGTARIDLKKGALACVEIDAATPGHATLLFLLPPKTLL